MISAWRTEVWPRVRSAAESGAWICFADESGASLSPPVRRTWSPVGRTPFLRITGKHRKRISMADICCYRTGTPPRLIYATRPGGFTNTEFPAMLTHLYRSLNAPVVLV